MKEQRILQNIYLDWVNNFLSIERFAEFYGISVSEASILIEICRALHERIVSSTKMLTDEA
jgi:hypothetical protein